MAESRDGPIGWLSPDPRAILPLEALRISRSLRQTLKKRIFEVRINTAFEQVMRCCAEREETWISEEIVASYIGLHHFGHAHSVETWQEGALVGGLYGVAIGGAFFGESMFSKVREASKVALALLVERMRERRFELLDTQYLTPHLASLGAVEISREEYLRLLTRALQLRCRFD
jgi:leucyl/phenylalanyl-tRNA--protein transferase